MRQSTRPSMLPLAATVLTVAWLFSVPVANAQTQSPSPSPSEQTPKDIPDQKLDAAATALEQVASVKEDYQRRIKAADPSDRNRIAEEAHNALVKAVTDRGLSVEEYTSILQLAENDPGVREKRFFSVCIDRPSNCKRFACVDHSDSGRSGTQKPIKQKSSSVRIGRWTMRLGADGLG